MALQELSEIGQQFTRDIGSILRDRGQEAVDLYIHVYRTGNVA